MSRFRLAIVGGVLVIFIAVGAYLLFANQKPAPQTRIFTVTVTDAKSMAPSELKVNQNDTITINISSNVTGEVHLHGYDIPFDCVARLRYLGDDLAADEVTRIAEHAAGAPIAGLYTYGEIARTRGIVGYHQQTFVVLAVG